MVGAVEQLPAEVLERVFHLLAPPDLMAVVLVCRRWREVGEAPGLWSWVMVRVEEGSLGEVGEVLGRRRMARVSRVELRAVREEVLEAVARLAHLTSLDLLGQEVEGLAMVEPALLARAITRAARATVYTDLTHRQAEVLFATIPSSNLRRLDLFGGDVSRVAAPLVGRAMEVLEEVDLTGTSLTPTQAMVVVAAVPGGRMRRLVVGENDLSGVEVEVLVAAVVALEEVDISGTFLTLLQATAILATISAKVPTRLDKLNISRNNLRGVEGSLLASALVEVREVRVEQCRLGREQVEQVLASTLATTTLTRLFMGTVFCRLNRKLTARASKAIPMLSIKQASNYF